MSPLDKADVHPCDAHTKRNASLVRMSMFSGDSMESFEFCDRRAKSDPEECGELVRRDGDRGERERDREGRKEWRGVLLSVEEQF